MASIVFCSKKPQTANRTAVSNHKYVEQMHSGKQADEKNHYKTMASLASSAGGFAGNSGLQRCDGGGYVHHWQSLQRCAFHPGVIWRQSGARKKVSRAGLAAPLLERCGPCGTL